MSPETTVSRTIELNDLTPSEIAKLFCDLHGDDQADFFKHVWLIAKTWPGAGWCQQSCDIASHLNADGRDAITTLYGHVAALAQVKA